MALPTAIRPGLCIPLPGIALADHVSIVKELYTLGYRDVWASETIGTDAFTPLVLASQWEPRLGLGTSIVPVFTRGPAVLAVSAAALAALAPGRFRLGLGTSSKVIVEQWNSLVFDRPYYRSRDTIRFLRDAFTGLKVDREYDTVGVHGFRLDRALSPAPAVLLAALRPQMLRLAGREADGVILNWLSADDVKVVLAEFYRGAEAAGGGDREVMAHLFVCPNEDADTVYAAAKRYLAGYLHVPVYAAFHSWLGRGPLLKEFSAAWAAGDRKAAVRAIPDKVVDELLIHGPVEHCRMKLREYVDSGVTSPAMTVLPFGIDVAATVRDLAPATWMRPEWLPTATTNGGIR